MLTLAQQRTLLRGRRAEITRRRRAMISAARTRRTKHLARLRAALRRLRREVTARAKKWRLQVRLEIRAIADAERATLLRRSREIRTRIAKKYTDARERAEHLADEERSLAGALRSLDARANRRAGAARRSDRASESDDAVRGNLPPELIPVYDVIRRRLPQSARLSRTEAFEEWAHDHPAEVVEISSRHADVASEREIRAHERELRSEQKRYDRLAKQRRRLPDSELAAELEDIPF